MIDENILTVKQDLFCKEYLIDLNVTKAAIRAGYSEKGAGVQGSKLLGLPKISSRINALMAKRSEKVEITAENVLKELAKIAFGDIRKLYDSNGVLKQITDLDDDTAATLSSFKTKVINRGEDGIDEIDEYKRYDKVKTLELIGKHLKMFESGPAEPTGPKIQGKRVTIARRSDRN